MNYFRHFEQLLLPTVVLETYEGRNTLQVSVVVFWLVGLGFFILGPVPPPPPPSVSIPGLSVEKAYKAYIYQWVVRHSGFGCQSVESGR